MERTKRVAILTGGGDVPGLNAAIKAAVETALTSGWEVLGIRRGWGGFLHYNLDSPQTRQKQCMPLTINSGDEQPIRTSRVRRGEFDARAGRIANQTCDR